MGMRDAIPQLTNLLAGLKDLQLAYIHLVESRIAGRYDVAAGESLDPFIESWGDTSPVILSGGFNAESANEAVNYNVS